VGGVSFETLAEIDATWPKDRRPSDVHDCWRWNEIARTLSDLFIVYVVEGDKRRPIAIWGAKTASPLDLPEGSRYRLEYLEVAPNLRGTDTSVAATFALATVAARAYEVGAAGIVLAAFPVEGLGHAYEARGAVQRGPKGWEFPENLVPYVFGPEALARLKGFADDLETPEAP
jgi:hypothetical protein